MPLTNFQLKIVRLLAENRSPDSHLAGGAALHFKPNSVRYSNDLDYFHDSVERVAEAFEKDRDLLQQHGYVLSPDMKQPGYIRAIVSKRAGATKVEWAHDSAWRFMPAVFDELCGYCLHPIDLAVNKVLALAGRNEVRDFLDILYVHRTILPLGPLCWAAAGKDPGFTPHSLLELLRRRGRYQPEEFSRLMLKKEVDLPMLKSEWLRALEQVEVFINKRPSAEMGCLYYSLTRQTFVDPSSLESDGKLKEAIPHFGRPGGVLPEITGMGER